MRQTRKATTRILQAVLTAAAILGMSGLAQAADWASVIMYHRFGEDQYSSTNIRVEQFKEHIAELQNGQYTVLPLNEIVDRLEKGEELPDRTVALTIDDAYASVYDVAWPLLREAKLPFTVFVAVEGVDKQFADYMNWDQVRELRDAGVHIGHHTYSHTHLPLLSPEEIEADINLASERYEAELGFVPAIFAYPYGEYGNDVKAAIRKIGFKAAFGQQSGVSYSGHDRLELPRFAMSENYGGIGRFRLAANALPLRVTDVTPSDNVLKRNPPNFGFTIAEDYGGLNGLSCFSSNQTGGAVPIEKIGNARIEIRLASEFKPGRGRINCTLLGPDRRWRWFGSLFYIPK
ncbi:polysaccharide deacetylase family protein [Sneathiella sp.]|uniref:polysaccharide deacetylase family protein n=1 Tax=Sneathiella sp. TaxID=1964365 RepID=UPI00262ED69D|nr:polysaccharide deacetylase family protein [Sneathiella sp.]MDF2367002.1 polysaccharide deacetylase family protein [Sneathiella sp.]